MSFLLRPEDYDVDRERGFLPASDPLERLPSELDALEELAANVPQLLLAGRLRSTVRDLGALDASALDSRASRERALLLLSVIGGAYVWGDPEPVSTIPRALAVPWSEVARSLDRPPIVAHASIVLRNWGRIDPEGPLTLDNLRVLRTFAGSTDEQWFYLIPAAMEARGAAVVWALVAALEASDAGDEDRLASALEPVASGISDLTAILERTREHCDPYVFYHRVRPFLAGWPEPGLVYEGVDDAPQRLAGGSAAQSSLFQAIDAALGIPHEDERTRPFLRAMRAHMPAPHRAFLEALDAAPPLRAFVEPRPPLATRYDDAVRELERFRKVHLEIAVRYITRQAADAVSARGTGGTELRSFLATAREETKARLIDRPRS